LPPPTKRLVARLALEHEANVVAAGGQFYPLIVETFGVWTPFARETLKDIASQKD